MTVRLMLSFSALLCPCTWEFSSKININNKYNIIQPIPFGDVLIHTYSPEVCPVVVPLPERLAPRVFFGVCSFGGLVIKHSPTTFIHYILFFSISNNEHTLRNWKRFHILVNTFTNTSFGPSLVLLVLILLPKYPICQLIFENDFNKMSFYWKYFSWFKAR